MNKNVQRWLEMLHSIHPEPGAEIDARLAFKHARPTFFRETLTPMAGAALAAPGLSRLDHLPDLPRGMEWPHHEGRALDFVAQINLADLEAGFHPALPETGWLYFFVEDAQGGRIIHHRVLYFDGPAAQLARTEPPSHLQPPARVNPETALLTFRPGFSFDPDFLDRVEDGDLSADPEYKAFVPLRDALRDLPCETTRLGGYPYAFQGGGQDRYALLYLNGFETLIKHGWFDPPPWFDSAEKKERYWQRRDDEIVKAGDQQRMQAEIERYHRMRDDLPGHTQPIEMLFGLESALGRSWGDVGFLEFFIREDDLRRHDLSRTFCDILST